MLGKDSALMKQPAFYCGTSNLTLPVPNKAHYPPEFQSKSRLSYYASIYNSVEINSSFYKVPLKRTVEKWASEVPDNFVFTFKLHRDITHVKELQYDSGILEPYFTAINGVAAKKGCVLIQFPPSIKRSMFQRLRALLDDVQYTPASAGWKIAVEFRDKSWYHDSVYQLLEQYEAIVVAHDIPASATPLIDMEANTVYLRFHGENGRYRGTYDDEFLREYSDYIHVWREEDKTVYAYFNNTMGDAAHNAMTLMNFVGTDREPF